MRSVLAIAAGVFLALLLQGSPAHAHGSAKHGHRDTESSDAPVRVVGETAVTSAPCVIVEHRVAVVEAAHGDAADHDFFSHGHAHDDGPATHNRSDHSHPFGEDLFHQMTAHSSLDSAAHFEPAILRVPTTTRLVLPRFDDPTAGITVPPPVPPPLG